MLPGAMTPSYRDAVPLTPLRPRVVKVWSTIRAENDEAMFNTPQCQCAIFLVLHSIHPSRTIHDHPHHHCTTID